MRIHKKGTTPDPLRTLAAMRAEIVALEKATEGLLGEIIPGGKQP